MTKIITKHGSGEPLPSDLDVAEIALDEGTGDLYTKLNTNQIKKLNEAESYDDTQLRADLDAETQARVDGDADLQGQLDAETQARIDGDTALDLRIDAVEDSVTDGGGFVEAPNDGKLYGRQSEAWAEVVVPDAADPDWSDIQNKPSEFPPSDHTHIVADITDFDPADYQLVGNYATEQYVDDSIAPETQARIDGDAALQSQLDALEAYDDAGLKADLATETQARIDGDAALQANIDAIPGAVPAPVDSVNGKTGVVVLSAADVGALPNTYDPGINYPVTSVNGKTGAVTLTHTDVGAQVAGSYAASNHNHDGVYQPAGSYAAADHTHTYASLTGKPTLYTGADAVKTSGNQTIGGIKTFNEDIRGKKNVIAYYSDIRLKDIQGPIENPVEKVKAIETFYYIHGDRARELGYEGSELQVGVSAQSVQAVAPELIHRAPVDDDGEGGSVTGESYMTVDYPRLVPLLIESIKQLSAEIEELKK